MDPEPATIAIGRLQIVPAHREHAPDTVRFDRRVRLRHGTAPDDGAMSGILQEIAQIAPPDAVLDVERALACSPWRR